MNIVIDTSVILAVLLNDPKKRIYATKNCNLLAPKTLYWEIGNAISSMFKKKRLKLRESRFLLNSFI